MNNKKFILNIENKNFFNDLLASLAFSVHYFIAMLGGAITGMLIIDIIFISQLLKKKIRIYQKYLLFIILIIFLFIFSFIINQNKIIIKEYFMYFLFFNIVLMAIGMIKFNKKNVIKYSIIIGFIGLPIFIFKDSNTYSNMGMGYSILPIFLISVIGLITLTSKVIKVFALCNLLVFGAFYIEKGMRGIILAIIVFFIFLLHTLIVKAKNKKKQRIFSFVSIGCILGILIFVKKNLVNIILQTDIFLKQIFGIKLYAFEKFIYYFKTNNISNNRSIIASKVIDLIKESPIIGHGIGYLELIVTGHSHNIFLQASCEFGIVGFLFIVYIFFYSLKNILFIIPNRYAKDKTSKEEGLFFVALFISGIFFLNYSSTYWLYGQFWFFLGVLLKAHLNKSGKIK